MQLSAAALTKGNNSYYPAKDTIAATAYITYNPFDISVKKWPLRGYDTVTADMAFGYTIRVRNLREESTDSIMLIDVLPAGVTLSGKERIIPPQDTIVGNAIVWKNIVKSFGYDSLKGGEYVDVIVNGLRAPIGTHVNNVQVFSNRQEATQRNNRDSAATHVRSIVNVEFSFIPSVVEVNEGDTLTLTLRITNLTPTSISALQIPAFALQPHLRYIGSSELQR